jgi:predicted alpha/beta-fold hydrolase
MIPTPRFRPHPLIIGGHAQTIVGRYLPTKPLEIHSTRHRIPLGDGDQLVVEESVPESWTEQSPTVVVVHGLAGTADADYVVRLSRRLYRMHVRIVRVNLRGAGRGAGLAAQVYHAGRTGDLRAVADWVNAVAPVSPIGLVGFSLGANLVLKLAGEAATDPIKNLDCVCAASPPADLAACCRYLQRLGGRHYDRNLTRLLVRLVERLHERRPELGPAGLEGVGTLLEFDERYTARRNGFKSADDYYAQSSANRFVGRISIPGLVVHARDDPFIPPAPVERCDWPNGIEFDLSAHGGHLGFISRRPWLGDRRWLETRIAVWLGARWGLLPPDDERGGDR